MSSLDNKQTAARHVLWHFGDERGEQPGGFVQKLLEAWNSADLDNWNRLAEAYPAYAEALIIVQQGGLHRLAGKWKL